MVCFDVLASINVPGQDERTVAAQLRESGSGRSARDREGSEPDRLSGKPEFSPGLRRNETELFGTSKGCSEGAPEASIPAKKTFRETGHGRGHRKISP